MALHVAAADGGQMLALAFGFNAFRDHGKPQGAGEADEGVHGRITETGLDARRLRRFERVGVTVNRCQRLGSF